MKKLLPPPLLLGLLLPMIAAAQHPPMSLPATSRAYAQVLSSRAVLSRPDIAEVARECEVLDESPARCADRLDHSDRIESYEVTYRYRGRVYRTRMPYDPGERVPVRPDVQAKRH